MEESEKKDEYILLMTEVNLYIPLITPWRNASTVEPQDALKNMVNIFFVNAIGWAQFDFRLASARLKVKQTPKDVLR